MIQETLVIGVLGGLIFFLIIQISASRSRAIINLVERRILLFHKEREEQWKDLTYCNEIATRTAECQVIIQMIKLDKTCRTLYYPSKIRKY